MSIVSELWIIDVWISMHTCCNRSFWLLLKSIRFNKLQTIAFSISESYNSFLFIALRMQQSYNVFVQIVLEREMNARNNKKKTIKWNGWVSSFISVFSLLLKRTISNVSVCILLSTVLSSFDVCCLIFCVTCFTQKKNK